MIIARSHRMTTTPTFRSPRPACGERSKPKASGEGDSRQTPLVESPPHHSRYFVSALFSFGTAAEGRLCLSPQAGRGRNAPQGTPHSHLEEHRFVITLQADVEIVDRVAV